MRRPKHNAACTACISVSALQKALQASYAEQELLLKQHQLLFEERDLLYQELMRTVCTDPMSGLPNHQAVLDRLGEAVTHYQQTAGSCAVLFLDLDSFKRVNDTWGHRAGDALLCEVARRLRMAIRPEDFLGRYGGDEFLMLLAEVDSEAANRRAEQVRLVVCSHTYPWWSDAASLCMSLSTTVSIGIAMYPLHGVSGEALISSADRAMYQAKSTGGNRVLLADLPSAVGQCI